MRVMVMFDLPVVTAEGRKEYTRFRKYLIKSGFAMMQESIYTKMVANTSAADSLVENIKKNKPPEGLLQVMKITEKQYSKIEYLLGKLSSDVLDTDSRLVIL